MILPASLTGLDNGFSDVIDIVRCELDSGFITMRGLTGAILILAGEQAFSHALLIGFPHQAYAQTILFPFAAITILSGIGFLLLGFFRDQKTS